MSTGRRRRERVRMPRMKEAEGARAANNICLRNDVSRRTVLYSTHASSRANAAHWVGGAFELGPMGRGVGNLAPTAVSLN